MEEDSFKNGYTPIMKGRLNENSPNKDLSVKSIDASQCNFENTTKNIN